MKQTHGLVTVEMSLALAFLLLIMLATAEFGRLFYQYNELTKAVGSATRYLSEHSLDAAGVFALTPEDSTIARNLVLYGSPANTGTVRLAGLTPGHVLVDGDGQYVTVSARWQYVTLLGNSLPTFGLGGSASLNPAVTLHASLTMRALH